MSNNSEVKHEVPTHVVEYCIDHGGYVSSRYLLAVKEGDEYLAWESVGINDWGLNRDYIINAWVMSKEPQDLGRLGGANNEQD